MAEKVALVTAASRGIGRGIATRLTQDGYTVVTLDREAPAALLPGESLSGSTWRTGRPPLQRWPRLSSGTPRPGW